MMVGFTLPHHFVQQNGCILPFPVLHYGKFPQIYLKFLCPHSLTLMCLCVYMCVPYVSACVHVCMCAYVYVCIYVYVYMCVCLCIFVSMCMYVCVCVCKCVCMCISEQKSHDFDQIYLLRQFLSFFNSFQNTSQFLDFSGGF